MLGLLQKRRALKRKKGKWMKTKYFIIASVLILLCGYLFVYRPYTKIRASSKDLIQAGKEAKEAFKESDIKLLDTKIKNVEIKYNAFEKEAKSIYWMRFIPFAGAYVSDFKNGVEAGEDLVHVAKKAVVSIEPYADLIGFKKGSSSFAEKSAEERLQTAVLTLDKMTEDIDTIAVDIEKAQEKIDKIDPNRYPKKIGDREIRSVLRGYKEQFDEIATFSVDAKPFIKNLPEILGSDKKMTYLVLFMNDKELRATGGFLTAYAVFEVDQGKFSVRRSDDIYTLDNSIANHPVAPQSVKTYHKNVSRFYIRDSNLSPDYVESVKLFDELYQKSSHKVDYDGIISVDTHVLVDFLEVLGDKEVRGLTFSSKIDKRCDCPQAIYALLDEIDRPVGYLKEDRKGILGDLLLVLMQTALGSSPSQYWGKIFQDQIENLEEKHILLYMTDKNVQKSIESIQYGGRIRQVEGDYMHISDVNFAGAKSNMFVKHEVESKTTIEGDGTVKREVAVTYKNPYKHSDCSLEGGLCLNATLRNWFRMYVPEGSKDVQFTGTEKSLKTYNELGKTVIEGFFGVKPMGAKTVKITYTLPFKVKNMNDYRLYIQKQPGTEQHSYSVIVNGKVIKKFGLLTDKLIRIP